MASKPLAVIFRTLGTRKEKRVWAFFPYADVERGRIVATLNGSLVTLPLTTYEESKPAKKEDYMELKEILDGIYKPKGIRLDVKKTLYKEYLEKAWMRYEKKMEVLK